MPEARRRPTVLRIIVPDRQRGQKIVHGAMVDRTKYVPRIVPVEKAGKKIVHGIVHELLALNK